MKIETKCLHEGYKPKNGEPRALPIYQSTTYTYDSTDQVGQLFDLTAEGHMYSRISNPTVGAVEEKIASLEGGIGALCTTSGQAASMISILNILSAGDHIVSAATIYGGTINLLCHRHACRPSGQTGCPERCPLRPRSGRSRRRLPGSRYVRPHHGP